MKAINGESRQAEKLVHISRITPIGQIIKKICKPANVKWKLSHTFPYVALSCHIAACLGYCFITSRKSTVES